MKAFEKMQYMSDNEMDIRLSPMSNLVDMKKKGPTCTVTFGVDERTFYDLMEGKKFAGGLLLADKEQFDSLV